MDPIAVHDLVGGNVVRQPRDHSCLYHSLCFFLNRMYDTLAYTPLFLRTEINCFLMNNRSTILVLGPGSAYTVDECIALEHYTVERYISVMSELTSWGGAIELACFVHMFPVDIYIFNPFDGSCRMKWVTTFVTTLAGRNCDHDFRLLYTGNSHYDCVIDAVFDPSYLSTLLDPEYLINLSGGDAFANTSFGAKRRKVRYQSIIETRRSCQQSSQCEPLSAKPKESFRRRAIHATRRLLESARPFKYYSGSSRLRGYAPSSTTNIRVSDSAADGNAYINSYDLLTKYIVCAICGYEGSRVGCVSVTEVGDLLEMSGIASKFHDIVCSDRVKTRFDAIFNMELNTCFKDGLIRDIDSICRGCYRQLLRNKAKIKVSSRMEFCVDSDLVDSSDEESGDPDCSGPIFPKMSLFLGLFCGRIPDELMNLTAVEESMINIYSAITNISLAGGKHFKVRGATCYTIINDLTSVAKELPRMPSIDCTAVLRHNSTKLCKDYTYRPNRVYRALNWLKLNNHLYEDIVLKWSSEIMDWANNSECIDIPFIEISDDEKHEIDEIVNEPMIPGETSSANPGTVLIDYYCRLCLIS